jgi:peptidylprolyl isomerase
MGVKMIRWSEFGVKTLFALTVSAAALLAVPAAAQAPAAPAQVSDWRKPDPANLLLLETTKGTVLVELAPDIAPRHVARIKTLVRQGYYDRSQFYRVIKGFMAQTGDRGQKQFTSTLPKLKREFEFAKTPALPYVTLGSLPTGEGGFIATMPVAIDPDGTKGHAMFCPGVASMAHSAEDPDSANSQFFLMRGRAPNLDATFSAWGRILQGQEAVDAINDGYPPPTPDLITKARIVSDMPAAQRPNIEVMDTRGPAFAAVYAQETTKFGPNFNPCYVPIAVRAPGAETPVATPPAAPAPSPPA